MGDDAPVAEMGDAFQEIRLRLIQLPQVLGEILEIGVLVRRVRLDERVCDGPHHDLGVFRVQPDVRVAGRGGVRGVVTDEADALGRGHDAEGGVGRVLDQAADPHLQPQPDFQEQAGLAEGLEVARLGRIGVFAFEPRDEGPHLHVFPPDLFGEFLEDGQRGDDFQGGRGRCRHREERHEKRAHHRYGERPAHELGR